MKTRFFFPLMALAFMFSATSVWAQEAFKIGLILPMTGQSASTGKQIEAAARLFMAQNGNTVAGRKIELIVKDDGGVPDATKRIAQELVVNDKVGVLSGFGHALGLGHRTHRDPVQNPHGGDGSGHLQHY